MEKNATAGYKIIYPLLITGLLNSNTAKMIFFIKKNPYELY